MNLVDNVRALSAATVFVNEWVLRIGPPDECGGDCGTELTGKAFLEVCEEFGVRKFTFAAEHPDSHGVMDRFCRVFS